VILLVNICDSVFFHSSKEQWGKQKLKAKGKQMGKL
jgi:hypothetical protein